MEEKKLSHRGQPAAMNTSTEGSIATMNPGDLIFINAAFGVLPNGGGWPLALITQRRNKETDS